MGERMQFVIFCIEYYKVHKGLTGKQTFHLFEKYSVIDFLIEGYDVMSSESVDSNLYCIDEYLKNRNALFPNQL